MTEPGPTHREQGPADSVVIAHPDLNYVSAARAHERSRAGGPWSVDHLGLCWKVLVPVGVVLTIVAAIAAGPRALAGSATGIVIVGAFFTLSTVIVARIGARAPEMVLAAALGAYILKIALLGLVIMLLPLDGPISPRWMAIAVVVGLIAWMAAHLRYIWTAKLFYTDPSATSREQLP